MKKIKYLSMVLTLMIIIMCPITASARSAEVIDLDKADIILETNNSEIGVAFFSMMNLLQWRMIRFQKLEQVIFIKHQITQK